MSEPRQLPNDVVAEIDLLARIVQDPPGQIHLVADTLRAEHFFKPRHEAVYRAALAVVDAGHTVDIGTVHAWLRDKGLLEGKDEAQRTVRELLLADLQYHVPELKTEVAAKRIRDKHALRKLAVVAERLSLAAKAPIEDAEEFCEQAEATISAIGQELRDGIGDEDVFSLHDIVAGLVSDMTKGIARDFVTTGFRELDEDMGGLEYGYVTVFGAPTNWGKTNFSVMVADEAARKGKNVLIVSFEDAPKLYGKRFVARRMDISARDLKDQSLDALDASKFMQLAQETARDQRKPFILKANGRPIENVVRRVRRICQSQRVDLIIWDYLQAAKCRERLKDKRERVEFCAREITDCTKLVGAAGLLNSQFRRMEPGEQPTVGHLKESGDIENGAECILLGFNDKGGVPRVRLAKNKDGEKNFDYSLNWNARSASFSAGERLERKVRTPPPTVVEQQRTYANQWMQDSQER